MFLLQLYQLVLIGIRQLYVLMCMKIAIGQINPTIGDFEGNFRKIQKTIEVAKKNNATLCVFPELVVTGYPPRDLLLKESFIRQAEIINKRIIDETRDVGVIFGSITKNNKESGRDR